MAFELGEKNLLKLTAAHPDLQKVIKRAAELSDVPFTVLEVVRTLARQKQLVATGASRTMNSRHLPGPDGKSRAVDIAPLDGGQVSWAWPLYLKLAPFVQQAAAELNIPVRWGGTWKLLSETPVISAKVLHKSFPDGPHFELWAGKYP